MILSFNVRCIEKDEISG